MLSNKRWRKLNGNKKWTTQHRKLKRWATRFPPIKKEKKTHIKHRKLKRWVTRVLFKCTQPALRTNTIGQFDYSLCCGVLDTTFFLSMIIYAGLVSSDNKITISYSECLLSFVYMYLCTKHFNLISVFVKRMKQQQKNESWYISF